jgi:hypothetical protein
VAHLVLDGILDEDVVPPAVAQERRNEAFAKPLLRLRIESGQTSSNDVPFALTITNRLPENLRFELTWRTNTDWMVMPAAARGDLEPGALLTTRFVATRSHVERGYPQASLQLNWGAKSIALPYDTEFDFRRQWLSRPTFSLPHLAKAPILDGNLDERVWLTARKVETFEKATGGRPEVNTAAYLGYDADHLYIAFTCTEPDMDGLAAKATQRGPLNQDDRVGVALAPPGTRDAYYYMQTNPLGTTESGTVGMLPVFGTVPRAGISRADRRWTVEIALPWLSFGRTAPKPGEPWGICLVRVRRQSGEIQQCPAQGALQGLADYDPSRFGHLVVEGMP